VAKLDVGGGSAFEVSAKAGTERATRRGKALRPVKAISFDEEVAQAVLAVS